MMKNPTNPPFGAVSGLILIYFSVLMPITGCRFPYAPQRQPDPYTKDTVSSYLTFSGTAVIYPVNKLQQSCNASVSPGGVFGGCILFLGYERLAVKVTDADYPAEKITAHDRLLIADTANCLRWYFLSSAIATNGELQCPEWSNHYNYIVCLFGEIGHSYSAYAVRLSDKKYMKLCNSNLGEFSTPYLWIGDTGAEGGDISVEEPEFSRDGFADRYLIASFFGTDHVKLVYSATAKSGTLYFVDFSESDPSPHPLEKPAGKENWHCASPIISPDGNWVAYHCFFNPSIGESYSSYIQKLKPGSMPLLIAEGASDPHWWKDPFTGIYYIVYSVTYGAYFSEYDYTDRYIETAGIAGLTLKQRLRGPWQDAPLHAGPLAPDLSSAPDTLIRLPFKGGISLDGWYLGTAYKYAYIARLAGE